jgi:hypothetical protein
MYFADQLHQNIEAYVDDVVVNTGGLFDFSGSWGA